MGRKGRSTLIIVNKIRRLQAVLAAAAERGIGPVLHLASADSGKSAIGSTAALASGSVDLRAPRVARHDSGCRWVRKRPASASLVTETLMRCGRECWPVAASGPVARPLTVTVRTVSAGSAFSLPLAGTIW